MKLNERWTVVGGLIGHCVSPNRGERSTRMVDSSGWRGISDLRAQATPTKMMMRQTARPTNEIDTTSRTTTRYQNNKSHWVDLI